MTSKLIPSNPAEVMVIRKVTPNITTFSTPFLRFGRFKIGGRGTIVRMSSGSLAVFSPVALTPEVRETITSLGGNVRYIAALDMEHHIFLGPWHEAFPAAHVLGPEGLGEKRASQRNEHVPFGTIFTKQAASSSAGGAPPAPQRVTEQPDDEFDRDFDYEYVGSHGNKELVFNYKPDRTLIEADLLFNLPATEQYSRAGERADTGLLTRFFCGLQNTRGDAIWQRRFLWYLASAGDRPDFNKSVSRIAKWDFDRIVPCHGDVIEKGGKGIFETVFAWHLQAKK